MDLTFTASEEAFREEVRSWLEANHPGAPPHGDLNGGFEFRREWQRRLHRDGWAGVWWPEAYGGRGASLVEAAIFNEEMARSGAPDPANVIGLYMGGPTLMVHGTEEQKARHLDPLLSAEEIWCQGFSEPEAGSDLAALKTWARRTDGGFLVSGQKVWTSFAHQAKWCMLLARTDREAPKHKGLTYFLLDMDQPGVQLRPLRQLTGEAEFNELFLDDAFVADDQVLGAVGDGWRVALTTLMNERAGLAFGFQVALKREYDELLRDTAVRGLLADSHVCNRLGRIACDVEILRLMAWRGLTAQMVYGQPGPEGSLTKWLWSESHQHLTELTADVLGFDALAADAPASYDVLRARGNTIEGGTTEVLKNIVAERVLGLPKPY